MAALETDLLAELIRDKHACLVQLRDMGRRQLELIGQQNMTALLDLLATKQRWLVKLQDLERRLDPFRGQDPDRRQWRCEERRQECARQLGECEALLAEIVRQEKRGEADLTVRRDEAARRLQGAHLAGQARGAYMAETRPEVSQLDLASET